MYERNSIEQLLIIREATTISISRKVPSLIFTLALVNLGCCLAGCVSPKYKHADKNTLPIQPLNQSFPPSVLEASLYAEINYRGPGSWKREAFWDEYIVTLRNHSDHAVDISSATLSDYAGTLQPAGSDPWVLEKQSKTAEKRYRDSGIAFARMAAPRALATTAEPAVAAGVGLGAGGAAAAAAATATAIAIPVYGATVLGINIHNRAAIKNEFNHRRLSLPVTLNAGESRTGSLFFPMTPNPQSLTLGWSSGEDREHIALDLHFLEGLHVDHPH